MDARACREHLVHVVPAQFVAQPAADRHAESALEAAESFGRKYSREGLLEQPLPAPAPDALAVGESVGEVDHFVVEEGHADLESVRHASLVRLFQISPREPEALVEKAEMTDDAVVQVVGRNLALQIRRVASGGAVAPQGAKDDLQAPRQPLHAIEPRGPDRRAEPATDRPEGADRSFELIPPVSAEELVRAFAGERDGDARADHPADQEHVERCGVGERLVVVPDQPLQLGDQVVAGCLVDVVLHAQVRRDPPGVVDLVVVAAHARIAERERHRLPRPEKPRRKRGQDR